ncbi:MAG: TRAP transporter substrate-binding protein DctP [Lachnospiraceae bacterium]|nr:TRAP transporter substrate-binding protein DctP [Lachnospiraceae bacterium]
MKKRFAAGILMSVMTAMCIGGCQSGSDTAQTTAKTQETGAREEKTEEAEAANQTEEPSVSISVGFENGMADTMSKAVEQWAKLLEEKSGGSMELVLYPDSQLGSKNDLIDSMQLGENVITIADGAFLAEYGAPDLGILYGPYLFENWDQVWKLVDSDWFKEQDAKLCENGLKVIAANWKLGERNLFLVEPMEHPEDLKGRKIRVPSNQVQIEETNAIGATATPMAAGEVYQALQTKTIDGLENVNSALLSMRWCEVAKYVYEDEHVYNMAIWVGGASMFDGLTDEQKTWLLESAEEAGLWNNEMQDQDAQNIRDELTGEQGVTFIPCTEEDKKKLISLCEPFYANGTAYGWSEGVYETIQEIIKE